MNIDLPFTVRASEEPGGSVLQLAGRVDRDAEDGLLGAYEQATEHDAHRVVLDFHEATYINSSGLAAIVALLTRARNAQVSVAARGLTSHYRHLFEITRLTDLVEVEPEPGGVT